MAENRLRSIPIVLAALVLIATGNRAYGQG